MIQTDFLFAQPSILSGLAAFFNVAGVEDAYNRSHGDAQADAHAIYADWAVVGNDLRIAVESSPLQQEPTPAR